jgi:hypothetical protein
MKVMGLQLLIARLRHSFEQEARFLDAVWQELSLNFIWSVASNRP